MNRYFICKRPGHPFASEAMEAWLDRLPSRLNLRETLENIEIILILRALDASSGVQAEAARSLGISRSDMTYKMRKYGLGS